MEKLIWDTGTQSEVKELLEAVLEADCEYVRLASASYDYNAKSIAKKLSKSDQAAADVGNRLMELSAMIGRAMAIMKMRGLDRVMAARAELESMRPKPAVVPNGPGSFTEADQAALDEAASAAPIYGGPVVSNDDF